MKKRIKYYWDDLTLTEKFSYWWKISGRKRYGSYLLSMIPAVLGAFATIWTAGIADILVIYAGFFLSALWWEINRVIIFKT